MGEAIRRIEDVRQDIKEDIRDLGTRIGEKVSAEVFELRMRGIDRDILSLTARIAEMEEAQRERERKRAADHRLVLTALVAPVFLLLLQVYLMAQGASGT